MATFRKRNDKWQVQVRRSGHPAIGRTFVMKPDAVKWARQMEAQADRSDLPADYRRQRSITVRELIDRYIQTVVIKKKSQRVETDMLKGLLRRPFANLSLSKITAAVFAAFRDERLKCVKPSTVRRELGLLQHVFEVAKREWGYPIEVNPLSQIAKPQVANRRNRRLASGEQKRLFQAASECRNKLIRPILDIALETGMRRSELVSVCWSDLDLNQRTLHLPVTKNGHPRTIPLSTKAVETFKRVPRTNERVFPITANALRLAWERLRKRAGITDLHFHDLRHEAISRLFERGLSVPEVALISGHRDYRMLFRYTHLRAQNIVGKLG